MAIPKPKIQLQRRDQELLHTVCRFRGATIRDLAALHFNNRLPAARTRIGRLKQAGLLRTGPAGSNRHATQILTKAGYDLLAQRREAPISWPALRKRQSRGRSLLDHDQGIVAVYVALTVAAADTPALSVTAFRPDAAPLVRRRNRWGGPVKQFSPDSYIEIAALAGPQHFFLELDLGTESVRVIQAKAEQYRQCYREGVFACHQIGPKAEPNEAPFRVLFVCHSETSMFTLARSLLTLTPPVLTQAWFATRTALARNPLGAIWITPHALRRQDEAGEPARLQPLLVQSPDTKKQPPRLRRAA